MLIQKNVFPDMLTAKYKTLGDEKLCLNNLHKKLVLRGSGKQIGLFAPICLDSAFVIGKEKADEYFA